MPLFTNKTMEDKRYGLLLQNHRHSVSEIATTEVPKIGKRPLHKTVPKTTSRPAGVHFNEMVEVRAHIHVNDYTDEEYTDSWFSRKELKDLKGCLGITVRMMVSGNLEEDTDEYCSRGLEIRTSAGCEQRKMNKRRGWDAALGEQERQQTRCIDDPELIASAFIQATAASRKIALMNGLRDELEVIKIYNADSQEPTTTPTNIDDSKNSNNSENNNNNEVVVVQNNTKENVEVNTMTKKEQNRITATNERPRMARRRTSTGTNNDNRRGKASRSPIRNFLRRTMSERRGSLLGEIGTPAANKNRSQTTA